jgi:hypothetical protein
MAGIFTDYAADKLKKLVTGNSAFTLPSSLQVAIYTGSAGIKENNPTHEANYTGYARASVTFDANGANTPLLFLGPQVQTVITHIGIIDTVADKILWAAPLSSPATLTPGKPLFFDSGDISISIDTIA